MISKSIVAVPGDGSCFFTSLAIAIEHSVDDWKKIDDLRSRMKMWWDKHGQQRFSAGLVRFMCASNVDENILELYNAEAALSRKRQTLATTTDLSEHMMQSTTWGDHASLFAFVKSLDYVCGVLIHNTDLKDKFVYLPPEWTRNKVRYIVLKYKGHRVSHYELYKFQDEHYSIPIVFRSTTMERRA